MWTFQQIWEVPDQNSKDFYFKTNHNNFQSLLYKFFYNSMQLHPTSEANCNYANDYKLHFLLGQGGQASVYLGSKGNKVYALKIYGQGLNKDEGFKRQVEFLEKLKFKYLISIVDADFNATIKLGSKSQKRAMIVLQYAEGELFDFISKQGRFTPEICRTLFKQLIEAIKFLDDQGITHRDLKPENILFDSDFNFKISDFGLSTFSEGHKKNGILSSRVGTEGYKPPEMEEGKYTGLQADLFAAGVILFVMYNGTPPFLSTKPHDKIYKLIKDRNFAKFWALHEKKKPLGFYPDSFKRLLNEFFSHDPSKRPSFNSLSEDQWLKGDTAMGSELKEYMLKRYNKIAEEDDVKKKVALVRKQMFQNEAMQEQCCLSSNEVSTRGQAIKVFTERSKDYSVHSIVSLPTTDKQITYFSKDLGFVLAFLNDYIDECQQNQNICIQDFLQEIKPTEFEMRFDGQTVRLKFTFEIDEEAEETLKIDGKLYQKDKKLVGIEWVKVEGNDFWLNHIIKCLNQRLQALV